MGFRCCKRKRSSGKNKALQRQIKKSSSRKVRESSQLLKASQSIEEEFNVSNSDEIVTVYIYCYSCDTSCLTIIGGLIESCLPIPYRLDQKSLAAIDVLCWVEGGGWGEGRWLIPPKR